MVGNLIHFLNQILQQEQENEYIPLLQPVYETKQDLHGRHFIPHFIVTLQSKLFGDEANRLLHFLKDMDSQLSSAQPVGGLPETAKEQLDRHNVSVTKFIGQTQGCDFFVFNRKSDFCFIFKKLIRIIMDVS